MPVEVLPWSIQGQSHAATVARNHTAAMMGAPAVAEVASVSLSAGGSHGCIGAGDLAVTQNGTPNMSVNVAAGRAMIRGTETASLNQGSYSFFNDGVVNLSVAASDPTNPRRDLVVAQVRDSQYAGAFNDARLFVVTGTAAASPVDPTVPNSCVVLARISVAAAVTTILNAALTDLRVFARTQQRLPHGTLGYAQVTAAQNGVTTVVDMTGLTLTWTAITGRRYRISWRCEINGSVVNDLGIMYLTNGSNVQVARNIWAVPPIVAGAGYFLLAGSHVEVPGAGSTTRKLRFERNSGSGTVTLQASTDNPAFILVEDIGPA